jgi:glyoxylase-like metal-dependent hydrolase (beta-lactamase superfamily II)
MPRSRISIGNVEIVALHDAEAALPLELTFPNVSQADWSPYQERYPEAFNGPENMRVHVDCFLIRSQGRIILADSGIGTAVNNPGTIALFGGVEGSLLQRLQEEGLQPGDIDVVFLTHLHPDHVGWNLGQGGSDKAATFPTARYVAHQADWDLFKSPRDQEIFGFTFFEETLAPLENQGVIDLLTGEKALTSEVTAISTPGHTPGSMSLAVVSGGQRALVLGDVFHNPAQVSETDWVFSFDADADQAVRTRKNMLERAEAEDATIAICHTTGFGKVVRLEGRRYWQAR